jgi:hypothetical protein
MIHKLLCIAALSALLVLPSSVSRAQASKRLDDAMKRMESPQQKMKHADRIMREQDRTSVRRGVKDKRAKPNARPGVKRMVLPKK